MGGFYTSVLPWGNRLLVRGIDADGKRFTKASNYQPTLYVPSQGLQKFRTLEGKPVKPVKFVAIKRAREWMQQMLNSSVEWYGFDLFQYVYIHENYPGEIKFDPAKIVTVTIDIEVAADKGFPDITKADKEITAITIKHGNQTVAFGCGEFKANGPNVNYYRAKDERNLLDVFLKYWHQLQPDLVTGWNISRFDIPYIINRIGRVLGSNHPERLSPWGYIQQTMIETNGAKMMVPYPVGVAVLDYMDLYKSKKFVQEMRESYSLNFIAYTELKEKKLDFTEYSSLIDLYEKNFQLFMEYNIHDVELVDRLEKKLGLLQQLYVIAYWGKINYGDVLGSVRQWDVIIHNYLKDRNIVVPPKNLPDRKPEIEGAYVKDTQCKMHGWFASLDLDSLYPHLIMQFNISPETYRGQLDASLNIDDLLEGKLASHKQQLVSRNVACAGNLATYTRENKGFLPQILEEMYRLRVEYKQGMLQAEKEYQKTKNPEAKERAVRFKNTQKAIKVNLNAAYGVLTNGYFRYYSQPNAEAVTLSGQLAIRWILNRLNVYMNKLLNTTDKDYIIAGDTDSVYLSLEKLVETAYNGDKNNKSKIVDFIDRAIQKGITPLIDRWYNELVEYTNCSENRMSMKRESIADKGVWTGKKHYILNIWDKEGVRFKEPEIEIKGIESVRSTTPDCCRTKIREAIRILMNKDEASMIQFIEEFRAEFDKMPFEDVATPTGVNDLKKYTDVDDVYKKGTPMHIKGALIHNDMVRRLGLKHIEIIHSADKIKFAPLIQPNHVNVTVIAAKNFLPAEFNVARYIDRDALFDKGFLSPVKRILDVVGWNTEHQDTLEKWFVYD